MSKKNNLKKKMQVSEDDDDYPVRNWTHPGGKLIDVGPRELSEAELLSIIIGTGCKGKSALDIANEIIEKYGTVDGLYGQPLSAMYQFKGMGDVKIVRMAAAFEFARRVVKQVLDRDPDRFVKKNK